MTETCFWFYFTFKTSRQNEFMCGLHLDLVRREMNEETIWEKEKNPNPTNTQPSRRPFINSFNDLFAFWQTFFSCPRFFSEYDNYLSKHFRKICPFNIKAFNITVVNRINVSGYPIARDVLDREGKKRERRNTLCRYLPWKWLSRNLQSLLCCPVRSGKSMKNLEHM